MNTNFVLVAMLLVQGVAGAATRKWKGVALPKKVMVGFGATRKMTSLKVGENGRKGKKEEKKNWNVG